MLKNVPQSMVCWTNAGLIPGLRPANERRRYFKFVRRHSLAGRKPRISPEMAFGTRVVISNYDNRYHSRYK